MKPSNSSSTVRIWVTVSARFHSFAVPLEKCQHLAVELEDQLPQESSVEESPLKRRFIEARDQAV